MRNVQRPNKYLEEIKNLQKVIIREPRLNMSTRKVRDKNFINKVQKIINRDPY